MAKMERVLLKRTFATPYGRFPKSVDGEPSMMPKSVIEKVPLPRDAVIVGEDYEPPQAIKADTQEMSEHDIEAEVNRRLNAKIAAEEARKRGEKMAQTAERADAAASKDKPEDEDAGLLEILDNPVRKIGPMLEDLDARQLAILKDAEDDGGNRRGVHALIAAALEDLAEDSEHEADEEADEEAEDKTVE